MSISPFKNRKSPKTLGRKIQRLLTEGYEIRFRSSGLGADLKPNTTDRLECQIKIPSSGIGWSGYGVVAIDAFNEAYSKIYP